MNKHSLQLEQAIELLLEHISAPTDTENTTLLESLGRVVARDIRAEIQQPPFDRSPLDGYAFHHEDSSNASPESPAPLKIALNLFAGDSPQRALLRGQAARIMTGAPIPPGADCVIPQEKVIGSSGEVQIFKRLKRHENYCFAGEDIGKGDLILTAGTELNYAAAGVLAGQGISEIPVFPKVPVGIFSTGSELVNRGEKLLPGKIYDSNQTLLAARVLSAGGTPLLGNRVADDAAKITAEAKALLEKCPLVITTGGVSVGEKDYMPAVVRHLGAELIFQGVCIKPGGPALACRYGNSILLCLSGNPFAAAATLEVLGMPVLRKLSGYKQVLPRIENGILASSYPKESPGRRLIRAKMEGGRISLPQGHASGMLASLKDCNCLVDIPAGTPALHEEMTVKAIIIE